MRLVDLLESLGLPLVNKTTLDDVILIPYLSVVPNDPPFAITPLFAVFEGLTQASIEKLPAMSTDDEFGTDA